MLNGLTKHVPQVEITGSAGADYAGDVAIDDIHWGGECNVKTLCHDEEHSCRDPQCIPAFLECNFYDDCGSGSDEHHCGKFVRN